MSRSKTQIVIGTNDLLMGGAQRLVIDQLRMIDRTLFDIHLIILMEFPGKGTFDNLIPADVTVHRLRFSGFKDVRKWWQLIRLLRRMRPKIVKTATFFSNTVFLLLRPFVGYAVIAAEHNTVNMKPRWQRMVDRMLLPHSHTIVTDSKGVIDFISKTEGIDAKHFTLIYNGVDIDAVTYAERMYYSERTKIRAEYGIPSDAHVIFTAGRLVVQKNHHLMIEGFAKLCTHRSDAYLVIAGGGRYEQELATLSETLGVSDHIFLLGEQKNLHRLYAMSDIFLLTSRHEGFCIAAMEGLAFGLPLISTRVAGVSEYLRDGVNGFFIEPNPGDIDRTLERAITLSFDDRRHFEKAARKTADEYSIARYGETFNRLLGNIMSTIRA